MPAMRERYLLRTPENVTFDFELAQVPSRALAWVIDAFVIAGLITAVLTIVSALAAVGGYAAALAFVAAFLIQWGYGAVLEWWWGGQTLGKMALGLRALSDDGTRLTFLQAVIRNLVRVVDALPALFLLGGVSSLVERSGRRLGDLAAGTVVVRERHTPAPSTIVPPSERYNSFVEDHAIALAVRRITAPEREVMVRLSLRRDRLPLPVRKALFDRLAEHLQARIGVDRPPHFSPEKYVLNLTAVALGQRHGDAPAHRPGPGTPAGPPASARVGEVRDLRRHEEEHDPFVQR